MTAPAPDSLAVVDENNRFERWSDRQEVHSKHLPHRSVQVFVFDSQHRLVLQKRHRDKLTYANYWDMSCSGHVEGSDYPAGPDDQLEQVYRNVASRELEEEIGVSVTPESLKFLGHFKPKANVHYEHFHLFIATADGPYTMQEEELEEIRVVTFEELQSMRNDDTKLLTHTLLYLVDWLLDNNLWPGK